ncbi:hypothetical protein PVAP13_7NG011920 [Panicum virgatum]|uniref:Uncharacterized protein n=1 Tax=Panicum virgatum TaxID=38727 RepID=A0A8T0Q336_PANVG|nr:hypothetical protein PVAP13_7NG011920 [Panicum virgatum]
MSRRWPGRCVTASTHQQQTSFKEGPLGLLESVVQVVNCWLIWVVAFQQRRGAASRGISSVQPHTKNEIWNN